MRIIAHLDMDAFFAAVEERDKPRLRGKPIVVGADPQGGGGRGVVSTANYAARKYGIRSAIPISEAWRLAEEARRRGEPEAVFIMPNGRRYDEVSERIMMIVRRNVPIVEAASVDEAYLDLSFTQSFEQAQEVCRKIKRDIRTEERLTASVGIGPNKLIAKIAADREKPDGLTVVREEAVLDFLAPLSIRTIPGVGPKTAEVLARRGVKTVADTRRFSRVEMEKLFGKWGSDLYRKVRGEDAAPVTEKYEVKSVSEQETYHTDTLDPNFLTGRIKALSAAVYRRFREGGFSGFRTVTLTVRFADFETRNRSHTLPQPANDERSLAFEALKLFLPFFDVRKNPKRKKIRLLGVRVEKLKE